jgi:hypothetical protein
MSKQKKAKKARRPNIPMATGAIVATGGGMEGLSGRSEATQAATFDYTHIKKDLTRIGILAGSFIVILVVLSFFIR